MKSMVFLVLLLLGLKLGLLIALLEHPFHTQKHSASPGSLENPSAKHVAVVNRKGGGGGGARSAGGGGRPGGRVGTYPVNGGGGSGSNRLFRTTFTLYGAVLLFTGFSTAILQFL